MTDLLIRAGFKQAVFDSQSVFRGVLKSMSEPGYISTINCTLDDKPESLNLASYAIALTLFDHDTRITLADSLKDKSTSLTLSFHCSSPIDDNVKTADFILCDETKIPDLTDLKLGTEEYPDQSCTLIIQTKNMLKVGGCVLTGAGIQNQRNISCNALTVELLSQRESLKKLFPLGIDLIFTCDDSFFCLPRTTSVEMHSAEGDSACT